MKTLNNNIESVQDTRDTMNHFVMYALNYNSNFIEKIWNGRIGEHLQTKFNQYYKEVGPYGVMIKFWSNLDIENQNKLTSYIKTYYKA